MATVATPMNVESRADIRPLRVLLDELRRRIRAYVWAEGVAAVVIVLGVGFWVGLAIDWLLEPSPTIRVVGWLIFLGALGWVAYRRLLDRVFVPLSDASLALLLERRFRGFDDSLLTVVELADKPAESTGYDPRMLQFTGAQAVEFSHQIRVRDVFQFRPLVRTASVALALVASIFVFSVFANEAFAFFMTRVALSTEPWPRRTRLIVEGFPEDGVLRVGRNSDVHLRVLADATMATPPPAEVEIRYRLDEGGGRGREYLTRQGTAAPGRDEYQAYQYEFKDVVDSLTFDILGGDARIRDLRIEVVDRPQFVAMTLDLDFPEYMRRTARTVEVTGVVPIPEGTRVSIRAEANKPLREVAIQDRDLQTRDVIEITGAADRKIFEYSAGELLANRLMLLVLEDDDGIQNQQPYRLSLSMTPDEPPQVAVSLSGIGTAVTPTARIPFVGAISDDYGLERAWFQVHVDEQTPREVALAGEAAGLDRWRVQAALDARAWEGDLRLQPGQRMVLQVQAADRYDLSDEPHLGTSQRFILDVVTPEQLHAMLENREIMLRQRFETIYNELIDTRDLLARIEFEPPAESGASASGAGDAESGSADAGSSGEDTQAARRLLRVIRAVQNVERGAYETLGVATGFDDIGEELVNNRIENDQLLRRLREEIAEPLRRIGGESMPAIEERLAELRELVGDAQLGPAAADRTLAQTDRVLIEMKQILDRMLELESYNEVIELLREILKEQGRINEETENQRIQRFLEP
jgi:hypothetical protein